MTQELRSEYIDIKDVKHHVEHLTVTESSGQSRDQILEELFAALTKKGKRIPA